MHACIGVYMQHKLYGAVYKPNKFRHPSCFYRVHVFTVVLAHACLWSLFPFVAMKAKFTQSHVQGSCSYNPEA